MSTSRKETHLRWKQQSLHPEPEASRRDLWNLPPVQHRFARASRVFVSSCPTWRSARSCQGNEIFFSPDIRRSRYAPRRFSQSRIPDWIPGGPAGKTATASITKSVPGSAYAHRRHRPYRNSTPNRKSAEYPAVLKTIEHEAFEKLVLRNGGPGHILPVVSIDTTELARAFSTVILMLSLSLGETAQLENVSPVVFLFRQVRPELRQHAGRVLGAPPTPVSRGLPAAGRQDNALCRRSDA